VVAVSGVFTAKGSVKTNQRKMEKEDENKKLNLGAI
jgi:hypothetical protein